MQKYVAHISKYLGKNKFLKKKVEIEGINSNAAYAFLLANYPDWQINHE